MTSNPYIYQAVIVGWDTGVELPLPAFQFRCRTAAAAWCLRQNTRLGTERALTQVSYQPIPWNR